MEAKDIAEEEIKRCAKFDMYPGEIDFVIAGIQWGRKEMVEWIEDNHMNIVNGWEGKNKVVGWDIDPEKWQAQCKEWGIK
jgi:hypothetical protein